MRELEARGSRLGERVERIAATARLIDDLSRRTTMLGVNAAIEAARAGADGAGFATVATEIGHAGRAGAGGDGRDRRRSSRRIEKEIAAATVVNTEGLAAVEAGLERQVAVTDALERISLHVDDTVDAARTITAATVRAAVVEPRASSTRCTG